MLISAQNSVGSFMNTLAFNIGDLVAKYKAAKNKDEEAIAIIDIARHTQEETRQEVVKELHLQNFATKADITEVREEIHAVRLSIEKAKFSAVAWILTGIWLPLILCAGIWFLKH